MRDIRFYDLNFNLNLIEPSFLSVSFCEKFRDVGSFEIHLPKDSAAAELTLPCMAVIGDFCGIVTGLRISQDIAVFGKTLDFLLSKRICKPQSFKEKSAAEIVKSLTDACICDFAVLEEFEDFSVDEDFIISSPTPLCNVIARICGENGYSLCADFENKKFVFKILPMRSNPIRLSADTATAGNIVRSVNYSGYAGWGWFGDVLISSDTAEGAYRWETVLSGETEGEAKEKLAAQKPVSSISAELQNLIYGKDYFAGDIFTFDGGGRAVLTEMHVDCDENGEKFTPTFEEV